jgi:ubiquitin-like protein Pup
MPQQTKAYRPTPASPTTTAEPQPSVPATETDELLDDIDACLEANALETVRVFVQRGGQ